MTKYIATLMGAACILAAANYGHAQAPSGSPTSPMAAEQSADSAMARGTVKKKKVKKTKRGMGMGMGMSRSMGMGMGMGAKGPTPPGTDTKRGASDTESAVPKPKR